jgi:putative ABC transport system ATP-binding protein
VAIARAMIGDPQVIFAGEPTGALDSGNGERVMRLLICGAGETAGLARRGES